jgi:hypothetical protein
MTYEYRMLPFPETLENRAEIATHLHEMAAEAATKGWEFYRVDTIGVDIPAPKGCLAFLASAKGRVEHMHVVTFRRNIVGQGE